jgi:undecaprenol kinase
MKNLPFRKRLAFAIQGIQKTWLEESSFRTQSFAVPFVVLVLILFRANAYWWGLMCLTMGSVLGAELLNTSLERIVDRLHPEQHPAIKSAKDCAAGAVLILSVTSVAILVSFLISRLT